MKLNLDKKTTYYAYNNGKLVYNIEIKLNAIYKTNYIYYILLLRVRNYFLFILSEVNIKALTSKLLVYSSNFFFTSSF